MKWTKKVTVNYHRIEAAEDDYFSKLYENFETMIEADNKNGSFESNDIHYQWELLEKIETDETASYFFSVVKSRNLYPVHISEAGARNEIALPDGGLGDISYGIINPAYKFVLCFAAGAGGCVPQFRKLLEQFTPSGVIRLTPLYEQDVDEKVMLWDSYKKVSISMNMPSGDDVSNFGTTKTGEMTRLLDYLGGLKMNITISAGGGKEMLSASTVKDVIAELLANELCTSLAVRGSDFENAAPEQFDLKNAQVKYTQMLEIEGNYITDTDAKQTLMRALNDRASQLFKAE